MSDYLRQKWAELDARKTIEAEREAAGLPPLDETALLAGIKARVAPPAPPPTARPVETMEAAREARRRGVAAAIARDQEPAGRFEGIASVLPAATQSAAGLPVKRLRILKNDVPASLPRATPPAALFARVRAWVRSTVPHGVSERCYEAAAKAYLYFEGKRGGLAQVGYKGFAAVAGYCERQMQRALKGLEGAGIFDILNVPYREDDEWRRDENIYVATIDAEPPPVPADIDAPDPVLPASVSRALGGGSRLAALFGLVLRAGGLNTSPASNYRTRPAPT
jgi:hypothetical protein